MLRRLASTAMRPSPPKIRTTRSANSGDPLPLPGSLPVLVVGGVAKGADVAPSTSWLGLGEAVTTGVAVAPSTSWLGLGDAVGLGLSVGVGVGDGLALPMTSCSLVSPQPVVKAALLASPA